MLATISRKALLALAAAAWAAVAGAGATAAQAAAADACSLLSKAEFERIAGRRLYVDPEAVEVAGGGSVCGYDAEGQVILFSGKGSGERFDSLLRAFSQEKLERHPVQGFGDGAYVAYPKPQNQYQDTIGLLVTNVGQHTLGVTLAVADEAQPAESVLPTLVTLAKAVVAKLR